jgi:hypothetical protein
MQSQPREHGNSISLGCQFNAKATIRPAVPGVFPVGMVAGIFCTHSGVSTAFPSPQRHLDLTIAGGLPILCDFRSAFAEMAPAISHN